MNHALKSFLLTFLSLTLVSCYSPQPQYSTSMELVPPPSDFGKSCANNCFPSKEACQRSCDAQLQTCNQASTVKEAANYLMARRLFDDYVQDQQKRGLPVTRDVSQFGNTLDTSCDNSQCLERCEYNFNLCYGNCGGRIIPHTVCTANCHLAQ